MLERVRAGLGQGEDGGRVPTSVGWRGVAGHQEGLARDGYAAVDFLEASLGISADCPRVAWVGVGDDTWRTGLEQAFDEAADEGRAVALA